MDSIFRFYKLNDENIEAISESFIYLFSAKNWEYASEFEFKIDIGSDEDYRAFLSEKLMEEFNLPKEGNEYLKARDQQISKLMQYGKVLYIDTPIEFDLLINILFNEARSESGIKERQHLIKNDFFIKTGICCFTTNEKTLSEPLHWKRFADNGEGFCMEYNLEILNNYFLDTNSGVVMDYIKYYEKEAPVLKNNNRNDLEERTKNYHEIFFSLTQTLKDEKEFRLAKVFRFQLEDIDKRRKQPIPSESILSLTIGPSMNSADESRLLGIVKQDLPNINFFKILKQDDFLYKHPIV